MVISGRDKAREGTPIMQRLITMTETEQGEGQWGGWGVGGSGGEYAMQNRRLQACCEMANAWN